jgi:type IV secretory pathway VirB10-like protein
MRTFRYPSALTAMLCAAALFAFACGRETEEPRTADLEPSSTMEETAPVPPAVPPSDIELREERSVEAREQVAAAERADQQEDLDAHDRELDRREAELEARARRLREQERRDRELRAAEREVERRETAAAPRPAPKPAAPKPAAPKPAPKEEVETRDVTPEPELAEPAPESEPEVEEEVEVEEEEVRREEPRPAPVTVEAGTVFSVELLERLSSESSRPGEIFRARVTGDVRQDGRVVIPAGSEVVGEVTEAVPLRKVGGRAKLAVRFTDLVLPTGSSVPIDASFVGQGRSETGRDAATIGGAAAGGAILGRVLNKGDRSKGAVIGAILGAAIGTAVASRTPGEEVTFDDGAVVDLKLDTPVEVRPRR